ncbi:sulfatase-like hydrolase/transferase [Tichowtungia aerotolerans]|uniref:Sulfatase-like hydrolase/transferase n=1 Tax=Tichowtungia aerotolerans TaxID=2697043 RepID=A0A6P1M4T2_9BACT|nr:sulfatase-like hydrolase/transferase [Tichowtungia aerotolerans]QHI68013.1 sulfatase-like hydrolase/transferase [Tichowtungia aerotolerans]
MSRIRIFLYLFSICCCLRQNLLAEEPGRPNIIIFMTDDAGYSDISLYGSEIQTPHIDQLAERGVVFRTFYNNARCSPTRASLLTGLYPHSVGVGDLCGEGYASDLPGYAGYLKHTNNATIAELLGNAGYETLLSGKWHLGGEPEFSAGFNSHPMRRGFDNFYGLLGPSADYFEPQQYWDGFEPAEPPGNDPNWYSEDAFGDKAVEWIEDAVAEEKPFFLHLAFKAPHNPRQALDEDYRPYLPGYAKELWPSVMTDRVEKLKANGIIPEEWGANGFEFDDAYYDNMPEERAQNLREIAAIKAGAIVSADRNVGKVMAALDRLGQTGNTLVFFFSDNGSALAHDLNNIWNAPFRGSKGDLTEGGVASHCIVQWPDDISARRIVSAKADVLDIMPTVLDAAGVKYPEQFKERTLHPLEGVSLMPLLKDHDSFTVTHRKLFWELYGQKAVIQDNKWKYYQSYDTKTGVSEEFLFDLENDGTELNNLIDTPQGREIAAGLRADWKEWANRVGAEAYSVVKSARKEFHDQNPSIPPAAISSAQLVNGSFEGRSSRQLVPPGPSVDEAPGWRAFDTTGQNSIRLVTDPSGASDGNNYIEIISTLSGSGLGDTGVDVTTTGAGAFVLSVGKTYTVSFDAKWVSGPDNSLNVSIRAQDGSRDVGAQFAGESFSLASDWTSYSYTFDVTEEYRLPNGESPLLYIGFRPKNGGTLQEETIRIDHVQVTVH